MPIVSVVTPFHNSADFLDECIEGVLSQTFGDFEYLLVDNASTDGGLEIAKARARQDARIRVVHFDELLLQIPNYNRAVRLANPAARYCKIAQADDVLFPSCLEEMVKAAESDPAIGLVGAYTLIQNSVFLDGLDYYERVLDGDQFCRRYLMDGRYIFGNPTTQLYRMADVHAADEFFPEASVIADAEAALRLVRGRKFAFVHQVLSYTRRDNNSASDANKTFNINIITRRMLLEKHGRELLDAPQFEHWQSTLRRRHYRVLGEGWIKRRGKAFWDLHSRGLAAVGLRIAPAMVVVGAAIFLVKSVLEPGATIRQLLRSHKSRARRRVGE